MPPNVTREHTPYQILRLAEMGESEEAKSNNTMYFATEEEYLKWAMQQRLN